MGWLWYKSTERELFVDLDIPAFIPKKQRRREAQYKVGGLLLRLRRAVQQRKLSVSSVWIAPSNSPGNHHVIVTLKNGMCDVERTAWELFLGSDKARAEWDLLHISREGDKSALLIRRDTLLQPRQPDGRCSCKGKHDSIISRKRCPVLAKIQPGEPMPKFFPINKGKKRTGNMPEIAYGIIPMRYFK